MKIVWLSPSNWIRSAWEEMHLTRVLYVPLPSANKPLLAHLAYLHEVAHITLKHSGLGVDCKDEANASALALRWVKPEHHNEAVTFFVRALATYTNELSWEAFNRRPFGVNINRFRHAVTYITAAIQRLEERMSSSSNPTNNGSSLARRYGGNYPLTTTTNRYILAVDREGNGG